MKLSMSRISGVILVSTLSINFSAQALPIDWTGTFGVDTHLLSNIRRTGDDVTKFDNDGNRTGTQGIEGDNGANFQTYIFRLNPQIIINDAVTFKGELSTGYIRGGFLGGDSANVAGQNPSNAHFFTTPTGRSGLNINQAYMELYADTALIKLGRMTRHYGLGAVFHGGGEAWNRFLTTYDGIEAEMKIGSFSLIPHWAKLSSFNDSIEGPAANRATNNSDVSEMGMIAKYDNRNHDLVVSLLYARRSSEPNNTLNRAGNLDPTDPHLLGSSTVTIIDPYISKRWDKLKVALEAPLISGTYGNVFTPGTSSNISANAYILEAKYDINPKWEVGAFAGQVSGSEGSGTFGAAYLHPNYQIADLMFRYHWPSFNEGNRSIFDSSITNTRYVKLFGNYKTDKWTWKSSFIMASALETAQGGGAAAYHHEENYAYTSTEEQSNNMGFEIDFGFDYRWNPNVVISGYYGYWFVGDYYAFTNSPNSLSLSNVHGGGLRATVEF